LRLFDIGARRYTGGVPQWCIEHRQSHRQRDRATDRRKSRGANQRASGNGSVEHPRAITDRTPFHIYAERAKCHAFRLEWR
jgi:hypothetical protein